MKILDNEKIEIGGQFLYSLQISINGVKNVVKTTKCDSQLINNIKLAIFPGYKKYLVYLFHRPDELFFSCKKTKILFLIIHGPHFEIIPQKRGKLLACVYLYSEKKAMDQSSLIIFIDSVTKKKYVSKYPLIKEKSYCIPIGIDLSQFSLKPSQKETRAKRIVYAGRFAFPKDVERIIKVFELYSKKFNSNAVLQLVGDGRYKKRISKRISKSELRDQIEIIGAIKNELIHEYLRIANVGILLSGNEGMPTSLKEFLACGVPVVASDVGATKLLVKNGINGYCVPNELRDIEIANKIDMAIKYISPLDCRKSVMKYDKNLCFKKTFDLIKSFT